MKRSLIIALLTLFGIQFFIGLAYSGVPRILQKLNMPGKLAKEHAEYEDDCEKCHVAWKGVKDEECMECHKEIKKQINSKEGLHFIKFKGTCASCHSDHKGRNFKMIDFDESKFQHEETGYELTGKHAQLKCNKCHTSGGKRRKEGQPKIGKYIGLQTECIFCHLGTKWRGEAAFQKDDEGEEGHRGQLGDKCDECHTEKAWKPSTFDHQKSKYPLKGKHERVECVKCHPGGKYRGLETDCFSCHKKDDAHRGELSRDCASCHTIDNWKPSTFTVKRHAKIPPTPFSKGGQGGFPLTGKHYNLECEKCHIDKKYKGLGTACFDCHEKTDNQKGHKGELGKRCDKCHTLDVWKPSTFDAKRHDDLDFKLIGKHRQVECQKCHIDGKYKEIGTECFDCHEKTDNQKGHKGELGKKCDKCHTLDGWKPSTFDVKRHDELRFKLSGKHQEVKCEKCHTEAQYKGLSEKCIDCHKKDDQKEGHKGQLGDECERCHTTKGWKPSTFTPFDHQNTEYPLDGRHIDAPCSKCHKNNRYKKIDTSCYACHKKKDEHKGDLGKVCEDCHTVYGWGPSTFDLEKHNLSDFKLTGKHAETKCQKCHTKGRYKNLDTTCIACHRRDDEKKGHKGELGGDCQRCHTVWTWKDSIFTHDMSEYRLTGEHLFVECAKCHTSRKYKEIAKDCYSCHISDDKKIHDGELGNECESCHTTEDWKPSTYLHSEREIERVEKSRLRPFVAWLLPERITPKDNITTYRYELKGKHADLKCEQCHKDNRYKTTEPDCVSCHAKNDKHVRGLGRDCERCHNPGGWDIISFDHRLSAFPLKGEHARLPCNSCHQSNQYKETSSRCQHCHAGDITHANDIDSDCDICHTSPWSWKVVDFNHNLTRFPLRQKHRTVHCLDCHREESFTKLERECFTCHQDAHEGKLGFKCEVCHNAAAWKPASYNHSLTDFPLEGKHKSIECEACHITYLSAGAPKQCFACHQKDEPQEHLGPNCSDCHDAFAWKPARFKHSQSGFPLTGKHANTDCKNCHTGGEYKGAPKDCYSCHKKNNPEDHFGAQCGDCHTTSRWKPAEFVHTFPINRGPHHKADCQDCHPARGFYKEFTCIGGGCHPKDKMDRKHRNKRGYVYDSMACFKCHPTGKEKG